jgi:hypothetical protein
MPREPAKSPRGDVRRDVTITLPRACVREAVVSWAIRNGHMPKGAANMRVVFQCVADDVSEAVITYREETPDAR